MRYFVEEYGLDYYAAFPGCADDTEPSARTVAFLIDKVREEGIPAVMFIEFSNEKMADVICEDTGCEKLLFHSCHSVSAEQLKNGVSYLELMWANVVFCEALRKVNSTLAKRRMTSIWKTSSVRPVTVTSRLPVMGTSCVTLSAGAQTRQRWWRR